MATKKKKEEAKSAVATRKSLCISINLLPREYRKPVKDFSWITDRRIVWPTLALVAAAISVVMLFSFIEETISELSREVERVEAEVERERPLLTKISDLEQKQVSVEKVSLVNISTSKVDGEEAYTFTIKVLLKQDLGMEG